MSDVDKKRIIKEKISYRLNLELKDYLKQLTDFNLEQAYQQFVKWIK